MDEFAQQLKEWILNRSHGSVLTVEKQADDGLEVVVLKDADKKEAYVIKGKVIN